MTYLSRPGVTRARVEVLSVGRYSSWVRALDPFSVHGSDYPAGKVFLWSNNGLEDDQLELPAAAKSVET